MLADRAATIEALPDAEPSVAEIESVLRAAEKASKRLESDPDTSAVIRALVDRVDLRKDAMQITLDLGSFMNADKTGVRDRLKVTRLVPLQKRRWGFEMRLVIGGGAAPPPKADPALLKAVARGFRWFNELATGRAVTAAEIARRSLTNTTSVD